MDSRAVIIGYTAQPDRITSSGARISTTKGDSLSIFEQATDEEKNQKLVKKVLASGHRSLVEHINFNLAFVNVSAYVEQFMIEFRLASFTVKSRRYVDFSNMGYVEPAFVDETGIPLANAARLREIYHSHMDFLFQEYERFVQAGIPKEDARFLLPYSYRSNFYCTVNARELCNILYSMLYGRGRRHHELNAIGRDLLEQAARICPYVFEDLSVMEGGEEDKRDRLAELLAIPDGVPSAAEPGVELLSYTADPENVVARAALIQYTNLPTQAIQECLKDRERVERILELVVSGRRPRELEQVSFTFRLNSVTLAAITHLTRHRVQSILVPPLHDVCRCERYLIPDTVRADEELLKRYQDAYAQTQQAYDILASNGLNRYELAYFYLSGNVLDITTTMNGRELLAFISLRACNRAQQETRVIAIRMLNLLRDVSPMLFGRFGPSCYVKGHCPEGKMTCGRSCEMQKKFGERTVDLW